MANLNQPLRGEGPLGELRIKCGVSMQRLADDAMCSRNHVRNLERGVHRVSYGLALRLASVLGVSTETVIEAVDQAWLKAKPLAMAKTKARKRLAAKRKTPQNKT
jgi:transcriptional regulator with XRE-family HTH domain